MIELQHVYYSYGGQPALSDVSLSIAGGETVALLGQNGSGKSTLLKLVNGIIAPDRGRFLFDGEEIAGRELQDNRFSKRFHQRVGFVFQNSDTQLFCSNVYDEIAFGPRQMGLPEEEVDRRVGECLGLLEIAPLKLRQPYHLSGGEKRRVAIAAVLALNPDVLTLDEPLNGLDPRTQRWLVSLLRNLAGAGKTLLISTHNLELVQELSTRAVLFGEDHAIAADGPTADLLRDRALLERVNLI